AFDTGICSYNVLEALPRDVKPLLRAAIALYARFRRTRDELTEAQAYRWLQRRAMQTSRRIAAVAGEYLASHKRDEAS
ncbi:response regulator, partial [Komagataeibacter oboediens]